MVEISADVLRILLDLADSAECLEDNENGEEIANALYIARQLLRDSWMTPAARDE